MNKLKTSIRIGRTLPPAAAPIYIWDIITGLPGIFLGQKKIERFNSELKNYFSVKHSLLLSSGKAALTLALLALKNIAPGKNEVVMPAYVCYSVPSAVAKAGLNLVLCDMHPKTLDMDFKQLVSKLNKKTLCVIVPHLFGVPAHVAGIIDICREKGIFVIEDAAQAIGVTDNGKILGTQGDIGFFSLGRGKTISAVEGGILITDNSILFEYLQKEYDYLESYTLIEKNIIIIKAILLTFFTRPGFFWIPKLFPFLNIGATIFDTEFPVKKMSSLQACFMRGWQKKIECFNSHRKKNTQYYTRLFSQTESLSLFNNQTQVCLRFPVLMKNRVALERIQSYSDKKGLGIMYTYPDSIDGVPDINNIFNSELKSENSKKSAFPLAKQFAQQIITLPVHPHVSQKDMEKIVHLITVASGQGVAKKRKV